MISRTHKIRLIPNKTQEKFLRQSCGCARYAYNWAVATWDEQYRNGEKPNAYAIKKEWTKNKPKWAYEVPKDASLNAILNLGKGFDAFFKGTAEHPHFHKKGVHESFTVNNDKFSLDGNRIRLPKIGWIRMREPLRFEGKICSATVSCDAGQWYVAIPVMIDADIQSPNDSVVGVDVGIKSLAIASDGTTCPNEKQFTKHAKKLKRLQRHLSRKQKKSKNRLKALRKLQKLNQRLRNRRNDSIHKFTSRLAKSHGTAVIETLDVQSMGKDKEQNATKELKWLRCLLQDTAMKEVHRQLEYKMSKVEHAPKFYASSKTCSRCGHKAETLGMDVRTYKCEECGLMIDRDLNAAINLKLMRWATPCRPAEPRKGDETGSEQYIRVQNRVAATSHLYLVPSDKVPRNNGLQQTLNDIACYAMPRHAMVSFDNDEEELWGIVLDYGQNILFLDGPDLVFELTQPNIDMMISRCRNLACYAMEIETDEEGENSIVKRILHYWDEDVPVVLAYLLRDLRDAKKELMSHRGHSLIIHIAY